MLEGDQIDLTKLPIPLQFAVDAAPYITAGQITARDPVTGVDTTGFHRLDAEGQEPARRFAAFTPAPVRIPPPRRGAGHPLQVAIAIGTHPLHYMGSMVYAYPPNVRKFEIIGGLFGEPYRVARSALPIWKCRQARKSSSKARFSRA